MRRSPSAFPACPPLGDAGEGDGPGGTGRSYRALLWWIGAQVWIEWVRVRLEIKHGFDWTLFRLLSSSVDPANVDDCTEADQEEA